MILQGNKSNITNSSGLAKNGPGTKLQGVGANKSNMPPKAVR